MFQSSVTVRRSSKEEEFMRSATTQKRPYTAPVLTVHGTLEEVTKTQDKRFGASDGFTFEGTAITNVS